MPTIALRTALHPTVEAGLTQLRHLRLKLAEGDLSEAEKTTLILLENDLYIRDVIINNSRMAGYAEFALAITKYDEMMGFDRRSWLTIAEYKQREVAAHDIVRQIREKEDEYNWKNLDQKRRTS